MLSCHPRHSGRCPGIVTADPSQEPRFRFFLNVTLNGMFSRYIWLLYIELVLDNLDKLILLVVLVFFIGFLNSFLKMQDVFYKER